MSDYGLDDEQGEGYKRFTGMTEWSKGKKERNSEMVALNEFYRKFLHPLLFVLCFVFVYLIVFFCILNITPLSCRLVQWLVFFFFLFFNWN